MEEFVLVGMVVVFLYFEVWLIFLSVVVVWVVFVNMVKVFLLFNYMSLYLLLKCSIRVFILVLCGRLRSFIIRLGFMFNWVLNGGVWIGLVIFVNGVFGNNDFIGILDLGVMWIIINFWGLWLCLIWFNFYCLVIW